MGKKMPVVARKVSDGKKRVVSVKKDGEAVYIIPATGTKASLNVHFRFTKPG